MDLRIDSNIEDADEDTSANPEHNICASEIYRHSNGTEVVLWQVCLKAEPKKKSSISIMEFPFWSECLGCNLL